MKKSIFALVILLLMIGIFSGCSSTIIKSQVSPKYHSPKANSVIVVTINPKINCRDQILRSKVVHYVEQSVKEKFPNSTVMFGDPNDPFRGLYEKEAYLLMIGFSKTYNKKTGVMPMYTPNTSTTTGFIGNKYYSSMSTGGTTQYVNYNYVERVTALVLTYTHVYIDEYGKVKYDLLWNGAVFTKNNDIDKNPKKYVDQIMKKFGEEYHP